MLIHNPVFQAVLAPFVVTLALIVLMSLLAGTGRNQYMTGIALIVGFLVGYVLLESMPPFMPPAAKQKIFYLVVLGGVSGLMLELARRPALAERVTILAFPAVCLVWFAWRRLMAGPDLAFVLILILLWAGSALFLWRFNTVGKRGETLTAAILLLVSAAAASGIALLGASITLALLCAAVAAAAGALVAWGYGTQVLRWGSGRFDAVAVLGGVGALIAVAGVMGLYTPQVSRLAMALLVVVSFSDIVASRIRLGKGLGERLAGPLILVIIAAVPALLAVGVAYLARLS